MSTLHGVAHFLITVVIKRNNKMLAFHKNLYYNSMICKPALFLHPQMNVAQHHAGGGWEILKNKQQKFNSSECSKAELDLWHTGVQFCPGGPFSSVFTENSSLSLQTHTTHFFQETFSFSPLKITFPQNIQHASFL